MIDDRGGGSASRLTRRMFLASTAGAAASALTISGGAAQGTAPSPRILTYSDHEPLGGMRTRFLKDVLFPAIERESEGRLQIDDHWDGEVAGAYEALGAVGKTGTADMATVVPEYTASELPLNQIFKGFPMGPTGDRQVRFFRRGYSEVPAFAAEFKANNIVPLFFGTGYPVAFYSVAPMAGLGGLAGGRWRTASFWHRDFLRNTGATPVTMRWGPEVPAALKALTLDGLMVNVDSGYMLKVHEAAPNILVSKDLWLGHVYPLGMNRDVWSGLAQPDRDAIRRAAETAYGSLGSVMDRSFDAQLDDLRRAGANVRVIERDELARWISGMRYRDVQSAWAEDQQGKGVDGAVATLAQVASIMDETLR